LIGAKGHLKGEKLQPIALTQIVNAEGPKYQ